MLRRVVNIFTLSVTSLVVIAWLLDIVSLYYLIPLAVLYTIINIIGSSNIQLNYFTHSYCNAITESKEISLTFDDGPDPEITPRLLELLKENNIKATFFCIGSKVKAEDTIINEIHNAGHIIGNHTYYHSKFFDLFSASRMVNEINFTNNLIYKTIGKTPLLFRPPYGVTNPMLKRALSRTKLISIGWSLRSLDTVKKESAVIEKLKSKTKPGDIVLFHDTVPDIVSVVRNYIQWLNENNFKIVSLNNLINVPAYEN